MKFPILQKTARSARHTSFYLEAGPKDGVAIIFVHGWPELSASWRHQIPVFAALGFRVIVPDMRGYGRSSVPRDHASYAVREIVRDMIDLADAAGVDKAIWVGHDWGSPIVWSMASHHPERCHGVANLCIPYIPRGFALPNLLPLVDRTLYPESDYPAGQWEYWMSYKEDFKGAEQALEADVPNSIKAFFRVGDPAARGQPAATAHVRKLGGWGAMIKNLTDVPIDEGIITEEDLNYYVSGLQRNSFFGADSYYMNDDRNIAYAAEAKDGGHITLPVLFLAGLYDITCDTVGTRLGAPMRATCSDLTEGVVASGHWMAQEKPTEVNAAITKWIVQSVPAAWPASG